VSFFYCGKINVLLLEIPSSNLAGARVNLAFVLIERQRKRW
jgi:hypothetical protein